MYTPETLPFCVVLDFYREAEKRGDEEDMQACEEAARGSVLHVRWVTERINETLANANNSNVNNKANG